MVNPLRDFAPITNVARVPDALPARASEAAAASYLLSGSSPAITSHATPRCMHHLARQHGLAHGVADGEHVRSAGVHPAIDVTRHCQMLGTCAVFQGLAYHWSYFLNKPSP